SLPDAPATRIGADSLWKVLVYLAPGLNTITLKAEDTKDNDSYITHRIYFKANYLPINNTSKWVFVRNSEDTFRIACDSSYRVLDLPFNFFRVKFKNPRYRLTADTDIELKDTVFFAQTLQDSVFKVGQSNYLAQFGDTLFRKDYPTLNSTPAFRFIGDTSFTGSGVVKKYRNCVQVSVTDTSKQIAGVSNYYLVPGKGFVAVKVQSLLTYTVVANLSTHPDY
ncbi:MAG: hypothetical protein JNL74_11805, partial [Fibrobacteres bacterium]|nr:hypothetical protein [Fibrobacterota bacterium]